MRVRHVHVRPNLPEALKPLEELAHNLWFSWNWEAVQLFIRLNPVLWENCYQNPVLMLGSLSQEELDSAAADESFVANLQRVHESFHGYMNSTGWFRETNPEKTDFLVAYFSCEYGIDECLPIYSGGLGVLSGDHLKSASDLGVPLVGVGLLYKQGYFRQELNTDGWQQEKYPENDWFNMPVNVVKRDDGSPYVIEVAMAGEIVKARVWCAMVGKTRLFLLDSNLRENSPWAREITSALYGGDREMRIRQEMLLGIGGVRALRAMGLAPTVYHMNEGHSAFLALERMRVLMRENGLSYGEAWEQVFASNVFTTHTPVPAGNEVFGLDLLEKYLRPMADELGLSWDDFVRLGQMPGQAKDFGMTVLALRTAAFANGVAELHGEVSRSMWSALWPSLPVPEVPITHITNGIHTRSWISHEVGDLFIRYLGPKFMQRPADRSVWDRIDAIPPSELWRIHQTRKERLVFFVRKRLVNQLRRQGAGPAAVRGAEEVLNPEVLTVGFARRFATYKRANLLFRQPERLIKLLTNPDVPVQFIFAGKAHPQDHPAKGLIKSVVHFSEDPLLRNRIVFIEDYDINVARYLVQGVDVWLNTPRRPLEASGTSGMKAAANGALNVSILDGWWCEGIAQDTGWAIGNGEEYDDSEEQDHVECEALFNLLEREISPMFYERDKGGLPREWLRMMKASIQKLGSQFNTNRMVGEYTDRCYMKAHEAFQRLDKENHREAKELSSWRRRVEGGWSRVSIRVQDEGRRDPAIPVGTNVPVSVRAMLHGLSANDVSVEVRYGQLSPANEIISGQVVKAVHRGKEGEEDLFLAEMPCFLTGRIGFTARVVPRHPAMVNPYTPLRITWES